MALEVFTRTAIGYDRGRVGYAIGKVSRVIIHHYYRPDVPASASPATERAVCRGVEDFHASKGWSAAPGYQWQVADSGRVYEGVGWGRSGVHTAGYNSSSVAICFMNDGDADQPSDVAWVAAAELIRWGIRRGNITEAFTLNGHRQFAPKSCPGNKTWSNILRARSTKEPVPTASEVMMFCKKGDSSDAVGVLQLQLKHLGFYTGEIDKDYGTNTAKALLAARRSLGSEATSGDHYGMYAYWAVQKLVVKKLTTQTFTAGG